MDELGSGVRNTYKYCGIYTPGTEPEFIEGDVFQAIIPINTGQATGEVSVEARKVVEAIKGEMKRVEIQKKLGLKHSDYFRLHYIDPALNAGLIELKYPDSPKHPNQKYRLTSKGMRVKKEMGGS